MSYGVCGLTHYRFYVRLREHAWRDMDRTVNLLYVRPFIENGQNFINPMGNVEIFKIEKKNIKRKLYETCKYQKWKIKVELLLLFMMNIMTVFHNEFCSMIF